jgi:hypothetical protein
MENVAIVGEVVAGQSAMLRKHMRVLAGDLTRYTFDLAEAFLTAQETRCYAEWGFASLGDYAELELGVKKRRAQYLATIVRVCRACGIARKDYEPVGITKLRSITSLDPETTFYDAEEKKHTPMVELITELVAEAPELSLVEVEERVAHLKGLDGENTMVTKSYSVTKSCYENTIQRCFESVRMRLGSAGRDGTGAAKEYSDGAVVECLAAEYNADPRNFYEDADESHVQIEVPLEGNNEQASEAEGNGLPNGGGDVYDSGLRGAERAQAVGEQLDSTEIPQESFSSPRQVIPSE